MFDIRLTPALDDQPAAALLHEAAACKDATWPGTRPPMSRSPPGGRPTPCQTPKLIGHLFPRLLGQSEYNVRSRRQRR
jgi:hypothetical protein